MGTTSWIVRTKSRCKTYFDRKTISKLTNSFTMMKFLAMFCLFIALFNEMEAKPIKAPCLPMANGGCHDDMVSERQDSSSEEAEEEEEDEGEGEEEEREDEEEEDEDEGEEEEREEEEEEDEDEGEEEVLKRQRKKKRMKTREKRKKEKRKKK